MISSIFSQQGSKMMIIIMEMQKKKKVLFLTVREFAQERRRTKSRQKCLYTCLCVYISACVKCMRTSLYLTGRGPKWMMWVNTVLIQVINHCLASCHKSEITLDTIIETECMASLSLSTDDARHDGTYVKVLPHYLPPNLNVWCCPT